MAKNSNVQKEGTKRHNQTKLNNKILEEKNLDLKCAPKNKKNIITKIIIGTVLKTIGILLALVCFCAIGASAVAPKFAISVFDYLGLKQTSYIVYERTYARLRTNESLYNVLQISIENKNYPKIEQYAKIMLNSDDFARFAQQVDEATQKALGEKRGLFADSYASYVRKNLVIALYNNNNKNDARMMAIDSVYDNCDEMYIFVQVLRGDNSLTSLQVNTELSSLYSRYGVKDTLLLKLSELDEGVYNDDINKIKILERKIQIAEVLCYLCDAAKDEAQADIQKNNLKLWTESVVALYSNLQS